MSRLDRRLARIKAEIDISQLLSDYGYKVFANGGDREQQFSCNLHGNGRDLKPSARVYGHSQSWYCVSINERVLTNQGWVKLSDPQKVMRGEVLDGNGSWALPSDYLPRPVREVLRVTTSAGYAVTVTPDHEIEVVHRGWIQAQKLRPGDVLTVTKPAVPQFSQCRDLPLGDLNERDYHPRLKLPAQWSEQLGECLGYVFGDGWVIPREAPSSGIVGLTSHADDAEDARRVFRAMQEWSSGRGSEIHRTDVAVAPNGKEYAQDQYVFTIGNDGFCEFFQRLGFDKQDPPNQRRLPESIWDAPEDGVRGFLRGMYATDGSAFRPAGRKGIRVNLYSVSDLFLKDVQLLLLQFGIHSRVQAPSRTRKKGRLTHPCGYLQLATGLDVLEFRNRIGIANQRKQAVLDSYQYNPRGSRSFKPVVKSVRPAGTCLVADISMPHEHSFVAGGIKVHNCFACDKTRDAVETVRAREGLGFKDAIKFLEDKYGLPPLPWEDDDAYVAPEQEITIAERMSDLLQADRAFSDDRRVFVSDLDASTKDRSLPMETTVAFWEALDALTYKVEEGEINDTVGRQALAKLMQRYQQALWSASRQ
jgi:hypothetical protein